MQVWAVKMAGLTPVARSRRFDGPASEAGGQPSGTELDAGVAGTLFDGAYGMMDVAGPALDAAGTAGQGGNKSSGCGCTLGSRGDSLAPSLGWGILRCCSQVESAARGREQTRIELSLMHCWRRLASR